MYCPQSVSETDVFTAYYLRIRVKAPRDQTGQCISVNTSEDSEPKPFEISSLFF